jgi:hypothetical protein
MRRRSNKQPIVLAAVETSEHHTSATSTLGFVRIVRPLEVMHGLLPSARRFHFVNVIQTGVFQVLTQVMVSHRGPFCN